MALFGNSKALREQLQQCQNELGTSKGVIAAISESMCLVEFSPEGLILEANSSYLAMMGYERSDLIGQHHQVLCLRSDSSVNEYKTMWQRLSKGETVKGMNLRVTKDKREIFVGGTYCPVFDDNRKVTKVLKIASDITRRISENDILEGTLQAVDRSMAVIEFKPNSEIITANSNFLETVGYELPEIVGKKHGIFCPPDFTRTGEYRSFWQKLNSGEFVSGKFERIHKSGNLVWLEATYNPIFDSQGHLVKIIKFATNVTDTVLAAQQTNEMVYASSKQSDDVSQRGMEIVQQAVEAMREVSKGINGAATNISDLSNQSGHISSIVSTISSIADQTNLLALNAAIEAARAGEQGRGFAVVADEVRQLASRTSSSTSEIEAVVKQNNLLAGQAVKLMEKIVSDADGGVTLIEQTGTTLKEIAQSTKNMVELISRLGDDNIDEKHRPWNE